jgi:hypothetical protein
MGKGKGVADDALTRLNWVRDSKVQAFRRPLRGCARVPRRKQQALFEARPVKDLLLTLGLSSTNLMEEA